LPLLQRARAFFDVLLQLAILLAFVLSGVLLAWMDRLHAVRD